jgi:hypothetical protein
MPRAFCHPLITSDVIEKFVLEDPNVSNLPRVQMKGRFGSLIFLESIKMQRFSLQTIDSAPEKSKPTLKALE